MNYHRRRSSDPVPSAFTGFRFPPEVITLAVRSYLRFGLSYRDVEELLAERGVDVGHVTVYRCSAGEQVATHWRLTRSTIPNDPDHDQRARSDGAN